MSQNPPTTPSNSPDAIHGGDLYTASQQFGRPVEDWIDLSTGISPFAYPFSPIPQQAFQRLPYIKPELLIKAAAYFQNDQLLPTSGSQAVIQALPECLADVPVLVPDVGYREHAIQWQRAGRETRAYPALEADAAKAFIDQALAEDNRRHLVAINPNNPTGVRFTPEQLAEWAGCLAQDCYLIVDEAFIDTRPELSVLPRHFARNMVVLRSFGKFFGLAGVRLGFVFAEGALRAALSVKLGIWGVNGPAQAIAVEALGDFGWQVEARERIYESGLVTRDLFLPLVNKAGCVRVVDGELYFGFLMGVGEATKLYRALGRVGILVRLVEVKEMGFLRVGLVGSGDLDWVREVLGWFK